jgi:hypothetical protein
MQTDSLLLRCDRVNSITSSALVRNNSRHQSICKKGVKKEDSKLFDAILEKEQNKLKG